MKNIMARQFQVIKWNHKAIVCMYTHSIWGCQLMAHIIDSVECLECLTTRLLMKNTSCATCVGSSPLYYDL